MSPDHPVTSAGATARVMAQLIGSRFTNGCDGRAQIPVKISRLRAMTGGGEGPSNDVRCRSRLCKTLCNGLLGRKDHPLDWVHEPPRAPHTQKHVGSTMGVHRGGQREIVRVGESFRGREGCHPGILSQKGQKGQEQSRERGASQGKKTGSSDLFFLWDIRILHT